MLVAHGADPSIATIHQQCRGGYGCRDGDDADKEDKEDKDLSGVPPTEIGDPGVYPIHMATGFGYGLTYTGNEHRHVPDGWIPAVKYLLELGADVNARDYNAMTPLHNTAATGNNELILLLVEDGAGREGQEPDRTDRCGHGERPPRSCAAVPGDNQAAGESGRRKE